MFQPNGAALPGDVVRIPFRHPDKVQRIGGGLLPFPGGIAFGHDDEIYVSINTLTFSPGTGAGAVVRLGSTDRSAGPAARPPESRPRQRPA